MTWTKLFMSNLMSAGGGSLPAGRQAPFGGKKYWLIISILAAATLLRFYHLTSISLWHDEAFSALLIKYPWSEMFYRIGLDVHPPAYYVVLRFWSYIFGDSLLSLRGMSLFFGVGTVWAAYLFVKQAFNSEKIAIITALLLAVSPFQLQYVTEARMYTMGAFFAILAAYFLIKALRQQHQMFLDLKLEMPNLPQDIKLKKQCILNYFYFSLCVIILIYTHYYLLFTAAAFCLYGAFYCLSHFKRHYKEYYLLIASFLLIGFSYVPWLKIFLFQYKQVGAGYWIPPIDRWSIPTTFWQMLLGIGIDIAKPRTQLMVSLVFILCLYILYKFLKHIQQKEKWLVFLGVIAPFLGALLFFLLAKLKHSNSSVFMIRYFLFSSCFFTIAVAAWLAGTKKLKLAYLLIAALSLMNLWTFFYYWRDIKISEKPGMYGAARLLQENIEPKHKLYIGSSFEFFNLKYYLTQYPPMGNPNIKPLLFSGGNKEVKNLPHFAGTAILTDQDLLPNFNRDVVNGDTVWLIWTNGFGSNKPQVPSNWTQIDEKSFAEVRPWVGTNIYVVRYQVN